MAETAISIETSRRGEIVGFLALVLTGLVWFGQDRQDKGAIVKAQEFSATLLTQRNRENDAMRDDLKELRHMLIDCRAKQ